VVDAEQPLSQRLRDEFPVVDAFTPLLLEGEPSRDLIKVNVHFRDRVAVASRRLGQGEVVVSALGANQRAFESPELCALLRRSLLRPYEGPPTRDLGVAIVGYGPLGGMGYAHSLGVRATDGLSLAAFCDTNMARLEAAGALFPEAKLYRSVDEVMSDAQVDVAIVATPPSTHTALSLQLLRAGKHVICEKPHCFSLAEADEMIEAALSRGLALTVNQNRRWDPDFLTIRKAIADGLLGSVFNFETFVGSFEHPCREWHSESTISGGAEFDWGAHFIDWTLQVMGGPPRLVIANGHKRVWHDVTNLDQVRVRMYWEDGREAEFMHSDVAAVRRPKFYVQGTEGTLVGHYRPLVTERIEAGRGYVREEAHHAEAPADLGLTRYEPLGGGLREHRLALTQPVPYAFYKNLADHLLLDDPPLAVDYRSTRNLISVLEAAHASAERGGQPITLA
jgi:predicted dehydrogenase